MPTLSIARENHEPVDLHYEVAGTGSPVVLIHGWPLSGRSWEKQVPALVRAGHQVITYDRRGFGESSKTWEGYDYETFAADLDSLLTHLDLRDATLVGFSMGGGEVVRYLASYGPERVSRAVLAAAVPPYLYASEDNPDGGLDDDTIAQFQSAVADDRQAFLDGFVADFFTAGDGGELVSVAQHQYHRQIAAFASPKGTYDCIAAFAHTDFRPDLGKIDVPTLVIHGDSDGIVPFEVSGQRSAELLSSSTVHVIEGGPHGINLTHADEFNRALIDFLAR